MSVRAAGRVTSEHTERLRFATIQLREENVRKKGTHLTRNADFKEAPDAKGHRIREGAVGEEMTVNLEDLNCIIRKIREQSH